MGKINHKYPVARTIALAVFIGLCLLIGTAHSAVPGESDLFEKAYGFYQSGDHGKAAEHFGTFLKEYPESSVRDSVLFWQAKSFIQLGSFDRATGLLETLIRQYPQSSFSGFARQELEVMSQTAPSVPPEPVTGAATQTTQQQEPASCSEYLKKADDRFRVLKEQLSDAYAKNQSLEYDLTATTRDRQYLKSVIEELKQAGEGAPKGAVEIGLMKAENERLKQELRTLSSRQLPRDGLDGSGKQMVDKELLDDVLRKNKALEQKNRETLEKALLYIRQTDERIQKLESEREMDKARLKEAEKRQAEFRNKQAGTDGALSKTETQVRKSGGETGLLEKKVRDQQTTLLELQNERDELRKKLTEAEVIHEELKTRVSRLTETEKARTEAFRARDDAKDLDAYSRLREESSQLAPAVNKVEVRIRQLEEENASLRKRAKEAEQHEADGERKLSRIAKDRAEAEQKRAEIEVQAKKAIADRVLLERQLKEKDAAIATLQKVQAEKENLRTEQGRNHTGTKQKLGSKAPMKKGQKSRNRRDNSKKTNNHNRRR